MAITYSTSIVVIFRHRVLLSPLVIDMQVCTCRHADFGLS